MMDPVLSVSGLTKAFGAQPVLREIGFTVSAGECVSFIGENGAGKSTLGKCLVGVHAPDSGTMLLDGGGYAPDSPRAALRAGVGIVPQELAYVPEMTAFENIALGAWPGRLGFTLPRTMRDHVRQGMARFGIEFDADRRMRELSLAERQLVEVLKALMRDAKLLVLDEPTAVLGAHESSQLIEVLNRLKGEGLAAVYISHRMDEVHRFSDTVHVLRNGELVLSTAPDASTERELITAMLGQEPRTLVTERAQPGDTVVRLDGLVPSPGAEPIDLEVRRGEIVAVFGVRGAGQDEIAEVLGGLRHPLAGGILVGSRRVHGFGSPRRAQSAGISYVPAERKRNGLVLGMSIRANGTLTVLDRISRLGVIDAAQERDIASRFAERLALRYRSFDQSVGTLSGGNQQKVLIGSRLAQASPALVLHEPSRGVDVGARLQIHERLRELAGDGMACLLVTSDVEEAVTVSDRILVIRDGRLVAELEGTDRTTQKTLESATGVQG